MRRLPRAALLAFFASLGLGCGSDSGTYCQSGPRYGTQCYTTVPQTTPDPASPVPPREPTPGPTWR